MTETAADIAALSPDEATAKLADMTAAFRGPPSQEPQAQLDRFYADPSKRQLLEAGDGATRKEFDELAKAAANADPVEAVMKGALPEVVNSEQRLMADFADHLRSIGVRDEVVREALENKPITQELHNSAKDWRTAHMKDREFVKKYLEGDVEAVKLMAACHILLTLPIKEKAA